jgi:osmotically-inducible protein OsmY
MIHRIILLLIGIIATTHLSGCAGVIFGGVAAGAGVAHDRRTTGTMVEDQSIETKTYAALDQIEGVKDESHINVTSYNKVVLLSGEVTTQELKEKAEETARGIPHVQEVHNELVVASPTSLGERSNDAWITTKVKSSFFQINDMPDFDPSRVKVVTERSVVYLFGLVDPEEANAAVETARRVSGVQKVVTLFEYQSSGQEAPT